MVCQTTGNILLWNGEIFASDRLNIGDHENDGARLFDELNKTTENNSRQILDIFESISGPYAFVYYVNATRGVYFGRDRFGRRSLLVSADSSSPFLTLTSVKTKSSSQEQDFQELKANGIYEAQFKGKHRKALS